MIIPTVGSTAGLFICAVLWRPAPTGGPPRGRRWGGGCPTALDPTGQVLVQGELWQAVAQNGAVAVGETVRITAVEGLTLHVVRAGNQRSDREETRA